MKNLNAILEIIYFIGRLIMVGCLIWYSVVLEFPVVLLIILIYIILKLIIIDIKWLIDVISITRYLCSLNEDEIQEFVNNPNSQNYNELKELLHSNAVLIDNKDVILKVKGYYLSYNEDKKEIEASVYLSDYKLYSMDKVIFIKGDNNG